MEKAVVDCLGQIVGVSNVITDRKRMQDYLFDETPQLMRPQPANDLVLVKPGGADEISQILKFANSHKLPVFLRGGGTGLVGGAVPVDDGIILALERMGRLEIDDENLMAIAEAGVTLDRLLRAVSDIDLSFPLHPGDETAQIGGLTATNAGGAGAIRHGVMRTHVKGIEAVLPTGEEIELAESLMTEFVETGLKPLLPAFIDLMTMYLSLGLNDKLEFTFYQSLERISPDRMIYSIYLDSLVKTGNLVKAEEIFNQMLSNEAVGINSQSCNSLLRGHINSGDYVKAEKIYDLMCQKKYDIEADLMEKLDFVLSLSRKVVKKPISLKLSKEKREMLVGLLLGGLRMESDEERKNHAIYFEFKQDHGTHISLKRHLYDQFHESLSNSCRRPPGDDTTPDMFYTISHTYFGFYADQFWPKGRSVIPKLIHRWLSPRVLAYWYMYSGHLTSSGDILLKVKGDPEGVEKIVKTLRAKSLDCKVKRKGRVFWIGFLGSNSTWFWKLAEPYILDEIKDLLKPGEETLENRTPETPTISFDGASDSDEDSIDYSDDDNSS